MAYRGTQWHVPVRESVRIKREGTKLVVSPPKGYGGGDIKYGDTVMVIPGCAPGAPITGVAVPPEGPAWMEERGWVGVRDRDGDVTNYQKKCLWKRI